MGCQRARQVECGVDGAGDIGGVLERMGGGQCRQERETGGVKGQEPNAADVPVDQQAATAGIEIDAGVEIAAGLMGIPYPVDGIGRSH